MGSPPRSDPEMAVDDGPVFDGRPSWKVTRVLRDGAEITIRGIHPDDREALRAAYRETSAATRYLRFLGPVGELSEDTLTYLTDVDQKSHIALVATTTSPDLKTERGLGVARLIRIAGEPTAAEAAITVVDDAQRRGVGVALARELQRVAQARGIHTIRADVLAENAAMRAILESAGAKEIPARGTSDTVSYELEIVKRVSEQRLIVLLRGAAETMAIALKKLVPPADSR